MAFLAIGDKSSNPFSFLFISGLMIRTVISEKNKIIQDFLNFFETENYASSFKARTCQLMHKNTYKRAEIHIHVHSCSYLYKQYFSTTQSNIFI